jgi:hypothetical protein
MLVKTGVLLLESHLQLFLSQPIFYFISRDSLKKGLGTWLKW